MLYAQLRSMVVLLLVLAALVSLLVGDLLEAVAIGCVLLINTALGFTIEIRARRAMDALLRLEVARAVAVRDGTSHEIDARQLVPGDVIELEAGRRVPADARLLAGADVRADEATLTGESMPVAKSGEPVAEDAPLPDRGSMLYVGTTVVGGAGRAVVVATGMRTELGRIGRLVGAHAGRADAARAPARRARPASRLAGAARRRVGGGPRRAARHAVARHRADRARARGRGGTGRPARCRDGRAGARRASHGAAARARAPAAVGRDARRGDHDLHRQDRHAHRRRADGDRARVGGRARSPWAAPATRARAASPRTGGRSPPERMRCCRRRCAPGCWRTARSSRREGAGWCVEGDPTEAALLVAGHKAALSRAALLALPAERGRGAVLERAHAGWRRSTARGRRAASSRT